MGKLATPTIGPNELLPASSHECVSASEEDRSLRSFGCTFYLEDTRARTKYVALQAGTDSDFHIKSGAADINFYTQCDGNNNLSSVLVGCMANGKDQALAITFPHMQRITSLWCFKYSRPVNIYSAEIFDTKSGAKWIIPIVPPSITQRLVPPTVTVWDNALTSLVAVFKEGMNSTIFSHKFLSYFKILEAYPNQGPFREMNDYCKENNLEIMREPQVLAEEMLAGAYEAKYHARHIGKKFTRIRDDLRTYRDAVAHPFISGDFIDLDALEVQAELAAAANMLERMAFAVLRSEFGLLAKVKTDDVYKQIVESYMHVTQ